MVGYIWRCCQYMQYTLKTLSSVEITSFGRSAKCNMWLINLRQRLGCVHIHCKQSLSATFRTTAFKITALNLSLNSPATSVNKVSEFLMRNSVTSAWLPTPCRTAILHCICSSSLHLHTHKEMPLPFNIMPTHMSKIFPHKFGQVPL